ncbi:hypothetical protein D6789_01015 [Candidatus Woesearchaeota archaeon]|nr:MAG: hypothetical protein D6789_01015 [Candidatus Woesearchaeota archaeon]
MKHPPRTTALLLLLFFAAQVVGLALVNLSIADLKPTPTGEVELAHSSTAIGERPQFTGYESFLYLVFGVVAGTLLLLFIIKLGRLRLWKLWFFFAVFLSTSVAFGVLLPRPLALALGAVLAYLKVFRRSVLIHNLTEIFIYSGIAVLLVPLFDLFWVTVLLIVISLYDVIAVNKTKHMVHLAKFQTKSGLFAGLMLGKPATHPTKTTKRAAILGGGDIAFPLLFAGVVMEHLISKGVPKLLALYQSLLIPLFTVAALFLLFTKAQKDKFYPAMPAVTAGCLIGLFFLL